MLVVLPTLLQTQVLLLACCCSPSVELRCSRCSVAVVVVRGSSLQYVNWGVVSPGDVVGFGVALPESTGFHRPTLQGESTPSPTITWLKTLDPFWAWVDHQAPPLGFPLFLANSQVHENSTVGFVWPSCSLLYLDEQSAAGVSNFPWAPYLAVYHVFCSMEISSSFLGFV